MLGSDLLHFQIGPGFIVQDYQYIHNDKTAFLRELGAFTGQDFDDIDFALKEGGQKPVLPHFSVSDARNIEECKLFDTIHKLLTVNIFTLPDGYATLIP